MYNGLRKLIATGAVIVSEVYNDPFSTTKWRDRAFLRCGFFDTNQYSLILENGTGIYTDRITDLYQYKPIQNYLSLYLAYQNPQMAQNLVRTQDSFIAHAGGEIDGYKYTNSLEALDLSYSKGARLFELDILETADKKLVASHDWNDGLPLTYEAFLAQKVEGKFTPLDLASINQRFAQHTDAILITDKINDPQKVVEAFQFPDRLRMELFSWEAVQTAKEL
jgi:hypothetical protein